jgi:hypothetical protein
MVAVHVRWLEGVHDVGDGSKIDTLGVAAEFAEGHQRIIRVFGCHHPNTATARHASKRVIRMPISIQYRIGAISR